MIKKRKKQNKYIFRDKEFTTFKAMKTYAYFNMGVGTKEDLNGNDVGRKLLILARELDLQNEFEEIQIQNLIPEALREGSASDSLKRLTELDWTAFMYT